MLPYCSMPLCLCVCVLLTITVRCRKFLQMSYIAYGGGPDSRNAQFVVHQCVGILYAMRVFFLHHCLQVVHCSRVDEPERISRLYLNGQKSSSFAAIQNIKRPAKLDIQKVSSIRICHHIPVLILCREPPDLGSFSRGPNQPYSRSYIRSWFLLQKEKGCNEKSASIGLSAQSVRARSKG